MIRAEFVSPVPLHKSTLLHVHIHLASLDVLGQDVGDVVLATYLDDGQLSITNPLLHPRLSHLLSPAPPPDEILLSALDSVLT